MLRLVRITCLSVSALTAASFVFSEEAWRWRDKDNVVHYTDNRHNVPPDYRKSARRLNVSNKPVLKGGSAYLKPVTPSTKSGLKLSQPSRIFEELATHITNEIKRDRQIVNWVNNAIAIKKMKELFTRDLAVKSTLLKRAALEKNPDFQNELEWVAKNISRENQLLSAIPTPNPGNYYLFSKVKESIKKNLEGKRDFLLNLQM